MSQISGSLFAFFNFDDENLFLRFKREGAVFDSYLSHNRFHASLASPSAKSLVLAFRTILNAIRPASVVPSINKIMSS